MNNEKKLSGLKKAAHSKANDAINRVKSSLQSMKKDELPINFESVARHAAISKSWLYRQSDFANQIKILRIQEGKIKKTQLSIKKVAKKSAIIAVLKQRITHLETENHSLKEQMKLIYSELCKRGIDSQ